MKILFCNIARMKYYKGIIPGVDTPQFGGDYVKRTGDAYEKNNFLPVEVNGEEFCFGFFETKNTTGKRSNQLHIEKIEGVPEKSEVADGVLVIWCAVHNSGTAVMGWYKNATVYRHYIEAEPPADDELHGPRTFIIKAKAADCTLLPYGDRNMRMWWVPRKQQTRSFGFGRANVWFAQEDSAVPYLEKLVAQIDAYHGENWLKKYP